MPLSDQEINEAVARKLGWIRTCDWTDDAEDKSWSRGYQDKKYQDVLPDYYHDIRAAWEIEEKCRFVIFAPLGGGFRAHDTLNRVSEHADTAPMAICLAFLKMP